MTVRSTSGEALMIGSHLINRWSRTPNHVTMSSAEADVIVMVKCSGCTSWRWSTHRAMALVQALDLLGPSASVIVLEGANRA